MSEETYHLGIKALVTNDDGKVLLLKINPKELHNNDHGEYWDLPGGRVEQGSNASETLRREVKEELGVSGVEEVRHLGMVLSNIRIPFKTGGSVGLILSVYECTLPDGAKIELSYEHTAFQWFSPAEAAELLRVKYPKDFCELISQM